MILDAPSMCLEIDEPELASSGAKERMLLVDGLERGELGVGKADRDDNDGKTTARANVDDGLCSPQVNDSVETVANVFLDLRGRRCRRQVDPLVPFGEQIAKALERLQHVTRDSHL